MREVFYCIYKKSNYKVLIYTSIVESILKNRAKFINKRLVINKPNGLYKHEKQILSKIRLDTISTFHFPDVFNWYDSLVHDCLVKKYYRKVFNLYFRSGKFNKQIDKSIKSKFNVNLVDFIRSHDIEYLKPICDDIDRIYLPNFQQKEYFSDSIKQVNEAIEIITLQKRY